MERDSPLKQWARKISPSKSRNKPLPPAPKQQTDELPESPTRRAPRAVSGKSQSQEMEQSVAGQRKSSISKMRHFFTSASKDHNKRASPPPQRPVPKDPYQRSKTPDILSSNSRSAVSKDHIRRHSTLSPGTLTQRILALESELVTTKNELARFRVYEGDAYEHRRAYDQNQDYNSEVEARYHRLVGQGHLDGLMETLMTSPERRAREHERAYGARSHRARHVEDYDEDAYHLRTLQYNQYPSQKSRVVSADQAVSNFEDRESILSAQQLRAEAELKELRSKMRHAAWEQVQAQTRAQLNQQAYTQSTPAPAAESDCPPSRGKDRSVSAPQQQSHQAAGVGSRQALRRVPGGLKKDLPALPEDRNNYHQTSQPTEIKSSIRAVSAPLERTIHTPQGEHENQASFIFPPPSQRQVASSAEQLFDDQGLADQESEKLTRKAHRRRPSERDINFMHESKRARTESQTQQAHKPVPETERDDVAHDTSDPQQSKKADPKQEAQNGQKQPKAPLGESTTSNVLKPTSKAAKVAQLKDNKEETETIDLDALSTPTKSRTSRRHVDALAEDGHSENVYSYSEDEDDENQDGEPLEVSPPDTRPPSPERRHLPRPTRLETVREDFEWDDDIF